MTEQKQLTEKVEKSLIGEKDQAELSWDPCMTGFIENIQSELPEMLDKLSYTGEIPYPRENEFCSFYMRIVDSHIEIGIANIEFIR